MLIIYVNAYVDYTWVLLQMLRTSENNLLIIRKKMAIMASCNVFWSGKERMLGDVVVIVYKKHGCMFGDNGESKGKC